MLYLNTNCFLKITQFTINNANTVKTQHNITALVHNSRSGGTTME